MCLCSNLGQEFDGKFFFIFFFFLRRKKTKPLEATLALCEFVKSQINCGFTYIVQKAKFSFPSQKPDFTTAVGGVILVLLHYTVSALQG